MDGRTVFREYSNGQASPYLVRAICLVTCKTGQATPFLRLTDDGPLLEPLAFASKLLCSLDVAIKADLESDRITKIQILALLHLHNDGLAGVDRSSGYLSQAISEAWAMSLQWNIPGNPDQTRCDFLWWSLRNFDRLNKPIMGAAPFIIDDTDVAIERIRPSSDSYRSQIMAVALNLGDLMKTATKIYKASSTATVDDCEDFPSLVDLTSGTNFDSFHWSHRAYLEIWYHVAAMLSCKYSDPGTRIYNRRLSSADRILAIISHAGHESLPPLPLVPYAISMSTTMIYRALRDGQRDVNTVYRDLRLCCDALDALGQRWTTAKGVARLAKRLCNLLTKSVMSVQQGEGSGHTPSRPRTEVEPVVAPEQAPNTTYERNSEATIANEFAISAPPPTQTNDPRGEQPSPHQFQRLPNEAWPGVGASYSQLDTAFHDLFDYGMPNVFRDPSTWDLFHMANTADGAGRRDLQFSPYLSSPELEFSHPQR